MAQNEHAWLFQKDKSSDALSEALRTQAMRSLLQIRASMAPRASWAWRGGEKQNKPQKNNRWWRSKGSRANHPLLQHLSRDFIKKTIDVKNSKKNSLQQKPLLLCWIEDNWSWIVKPYHKDKLDLGAPPMVPGVQEKNDTITTAVVWPLQESHETRDNSHRCLRWQPYWHHRNRYRCARCCKDGKAVQWARV